MKSSKFGKRQNNVADWLEKQLTMRLQNRTERGVSLGRLGLSSKASVVKLVRGLSNFASASIMWLNPIGGGANGFFAWLSNIKEGVKNSVIHSQQGTAL